MTAEFIFDKAAFTSCHASTIVEPEPGKLIAAWFGGTAEGAKDVRIWSARHDGMAWSPPESAADEPGQPCWNPVLFRSKTGATLLFYKAGPNPSSWTGFVRRSTDGGKTWSNAEQLPAGILGPVKNKPIQLGDGTIIAGTSVESYKAWACWVERSKDDGVTWSRSGPISVPGKPYGIIQPTMFSTRDGRVALLCRSRGIGRICRAESSDQGVTWTQASATELPNPNSGIDGVRTAEESLFLVYNHTERGRSPLNLGLSRDDGHSWRMVHTFEDQPGEYSYPAIVQTQDGRLHITYTWQRTRIKHVMLDPMSFK